MKAWTINLPVTIAIDSKGRVYAETELSGAIRGLEKIQIQDIAIAPPNDAELARIADALTNEEIETSSHY